MSTPNFGMYLSTDTDPMSNTNQSFGNQWNIIEGIPRVTSVASLPLTDFSYSVGARVYHTVSKSIHVLIAQDSAWGNFWRPVQTRYSTYNAVTSSVILNTTDYHISGLKYKISNKGKIIFAGGINTTLAAGYPNYTGTPLTLTTNLPAAIAPKAAIVFPVALNTPANTTTPTMARMSVGNNGAIQFITWNPTGSSIVNLVDLDSIEWDMGSNMGYGTDL